MENMDNKLSSYKYKDGEFTYGQYKFFEGKEVKQGICIEEFKSSSSSIVIPDIVEVSGEKQKVIAIGKKAFLGNSLVKTITVSESIVEIGDWAFSQCQNLEKVVFLNKDIKMGKGIFSDCDKIKDICLGYAGEDAKSTLIGAVPGLLKAEYLLTGNDIGTDSWFFKWDNCLASFLEEDDEEGYTNMVLCGEEDLQSSMEGFISDKRKLKAKLCMLRLMNEHMLKANAKERFTKYILTHMKGCESEESWKLIIDEYSDKIEFFKLLAQIKAITEDNVDDLINDMKDYSAETKSFLLSYKQDNFAPKDIFESFVL